MIRKKSEPMALEAVGSPVFWEADYRFHPLMTASSAG